MKDRQAALWGGAILAVVAVAAIVWWATRVEIGSDPTGETLDRRALAARVDSLRDVIARRDSLLQVQSGLTEWDLRRLQRRGLDDPERQLVDSLLDRRELIPYEGVVGGTMAFRRPEVEILSRRWIFAGFDDGHIAGDMLLEYAVSDDGSISWTVLDSYLE